MKLALEALEKSEPVNQGVGYVKRHNNAKRALRAAIAEAAMQQLTDVQQAIETAVADQATYGMGITLGGKRIDPASIYEKPEPVAWEAIEKIAQERYKVCPSDTSMFYRFAVLAGNGTQQLYIGREIECQNMARKFAGAFLDGAFLYEKMATPPHREWIGLTDEDVMVAAYQAGFDIHEDYDNDDDPKEMHFWTPDGEVCDDSLLKLRDIIEAKLKEKNT